MTDEIKICIHNHLGAIEWWNPLDPQPCCDNCANSDHCDICADCINDGDWATFFCSDWKVKE